MGGNATVTCILYGNATVQWLLDGNLAENVSGIPVSTATTVMDNETTAGILELTNLPETFNRTRITCVFTSLETAQIMNASTLLLQQGRHNTLMWTIIKVAANLFTT